jgi:hypothetical protein
MALAWYPRPGGMGPAHEQLGICPGLEADTQIFKVSFRELRGNLKLAARGSFQEHTEMVDV